MKIRILNVIIWDVPFTNQAKPTPKVTAAKKIVVGKLVMASRREFLMVCFTVSSNHPISGNAYDADEKIAKRKKKAGYIDHWYCSVNVYLTTEESGKKTIDDEKACGFDEVFLIASEELTEYGRVLTGSYFNADPVQRSDRSTDSKDRYTTNNETDIYQYQIACCGKYLHWNASLVKE